MPTAHKNETYPGLNIIATGNFHKAVNDLRDKARRAFYAIKRKLQFGIPIRTWLKILESVIEPVAFHVRSTVRSPTKNSQKGTNTKMRHCMQNSAKRSFEDNVKHQIIHAEQN